MALEPATTADTLNRFGCCCSTSIAARPTDPVTPRIVTRWITVSIVLALGCEETGAEQRDPDQESDRDEPVEPIHHPAMPRYKVA
jgi:hypothetical protein